MAEKDPLQNSINRLDNTMNALDKTVKGLTKAFNDMNRTEKSRKVTSSIRPNFEERLTSALAKVSPLTKKGTPRKDFTFAVEKLFEQQRDALTKYDKIREYGYNKDNPSSKLSDIYGIKEVQKIVNEMLSDLESKKNGISKDDSKSVRKELFGDNKGVSVDNSYKIIQSVQDNSEVILRTAGVFAQVRSEVANFQNAIKNATNTVSSNLSSNSKKVSNRLEKMASDSKALKDVLANLNHSLTRTNKAVDRFADRLSTATRLISNNNRRLSGSVTSINSLVKKVQKTTSTISNIQNNLSKKNSGSSYSDNNTFREQATRNSDRAKQAGFIALLIPALAKLLKKTPVTDLFKLLALKLGAGLSGRGEHPVLGAIGLMSAPLISGALFAKPVRDALFSFMGKTATLNKGISTGGKGTLPWSQTGKYFNGFKMGFTSGHLDRVGANVDRVSLGMGDFKTDNMGNFIRNKHGERIVVSKSGNVAGGLGYEQGRKLIRNIPRQSKVIGGRMASRIPLLGTLISAAFEAPDLIKAHKTGNKEVWGNQLAKSAGGVTGGTIGSIVGASLGAMTGPFAVIAVPLATMICGMIGDSIGRFIGPHIRKGFQKDTAGLKGTFEDLKEHTKGTREGFTKLGKSLGRIGAAFGHVFEPLNNWVKGQGKKFTDWLGKLISLGAEKTIEAIVRGVDGFVAKVDKAVNSIADLIDTIADGFHNLGQKLLSTPIIGPILQKMYGEVPEDNTVVKNTNNASNKESERLSKELKKYENPNSKEYKAKRKEFYNQYIKANSTGFFMNAEDNARVEAGANTWADKMMNEEKYRLKVQKANVENAIGTASLPSNLKTYTKNGIRAVAMKDLRLKGAIGRGNSVPYIAAANAQKLKSLDNYLASKGYKFTYTSAMGGSHAGGARSHGAGQKVDLVLNGGGKLKPADERWLRANGFYGGVTGAIGYHNAGSGWHYDLSVSQGAGLTAAKKASSTKTSTVTSTSKRTTEQQTASSVVRNLADIVGPTSKSNKQDRTRSIVLSAVDVTGSLGVWGITQLNNGVMKTGR